MLLLLADKSPMHSYRAVEKSLMLFSLLQRSSLLLKIFSPLENLFLQESKRWGETFWLFPAGFLFWYISPGRWEASRNPFCVWGWVCQKTFNAGNARLVSLFSGHVWYLSPAVSSPASFGGLWICQFVECLVGYGNVMVNLRIVLASQRGRKNTSLKH